VSGGEQASFAILVTTSTSFNWHKLSPLFPLQVYSQISMHHFIGLHP